MEKDEVVKVWGACLGIFMLISLARLYAVLPPRIKGRGHGLRGSAKEAPRRTAPVKTMVVLGSGGHTKEMLTLLQDVSSAKYKPAYFVRAAVRRKRKTTVMYDARSDERSEGMLKHSSGLGADMVMTIPRSRHVGQSWLTTPFTTLYALMSSILLVLRLRPELILCNGPGTCVPICFAGFLLRFLGVQDVKVVFVESFCRVKTLSLTGKFLYWFSDRFIVQWPELRQKYKATEYIGTIC